MCATCISGGGQKRAAAPLKLELQIVVKHFVVLAMKPVTSAAATSALQSKIRICRLLDNCFWHCQSICHISEPINHSVKLSSIS